MGRAPLKVLLRAYMTALASNTPTRNAGSTPKPRSSRNGHILSIHFCLDVEFVATVTWIGQK